jgi:hypothetical protein
MMSRHGPEPTQAPTTPAAVSPPLQADPLRVLALRRSHHATQPGYVRSRQPRSMLEVRRTNQPVLRDLGRAARGLTRPTPRNHEQPHVLRWQQPMHEPRQLRPARSAPAGMTRSDTADMATCENRPKPRGRTIVVLSGHSSRPAERSGKRSNTRQGGAKGRTANCTRLADWRVRFPPLVVGAEYPWRWGDLGDESPRPSCDRGQGGNRRPRPKGASTRWPAGDPRACRFCPNPRPRAGWNPQTTPLASSCLFWPLHKTVYILSLFPENSP